MIKYKKKTTMHAPLVRERSERLGLKHLTNDCPSNIYIELFVINQHKVY